ncbi:MAG: phosphosulfolactate synthase [Desulfitibacter sp. BRH_c19]|nr:MAG: phosphosulfolactate synthase [Desulfitibacter sp. BRH_c19]
MRRLNINKDGWDGLVEFPLPERQQKPRDNGFTMIIDKGMGLSDLADTLETAGKYIDFVKLGFGTSALYTGDVLHKKINLVRSMGIHIYPGGTFLEVAVLQGKLDLYLEKARALGYSCIEVSDGTINMSRKVRKRAIEKALEMGFIVLSEVGKKDARDELSNTDILEQINLDIEWGAYKVIVEGRESGKGVVIYDERGKIKEEELDEILGAVSDVNKILWEAPHKNQQQELIMRLGTNVNLGNIQAAEVMSLEALRVGLRGDTLRNYLVSQNNRAISS